MRTISSKKPVMPEEQFKNLFKFNYAGILRHLAWLTGEEAAAEDLAQEVFLKLYYQAPASLANPRAWLFRVATNTAYNYLRREKIKGKQEVAGVAPSLAAVYPDELVIQQEEKLVVREVLASLSVRDRTCLLMKHSGYSYAEIAETLGVEKSSVGTILVRAQERFRRGFPNQGGR